jgi:hypothetical protein
VFPEAAVEYIKWTKLNTGMILITETGQAMHREVRSSLNSVGDLSLSVRRRNT